MIRPSASKGANGAALQNYNPSHVATALKHAATSALKCVAELGTAAPHCTDIGRSYGVDLEEVRRIGESTHARMIGDNAKEDVGLDSWIYTRITTNTFERRCDPLDADECLGHGRHDVVCEYERV